jgi:hypothetical protein
VGQPQDSWRRGQKKSQQLHQTGKFAQLIQKYAVSDSMPEEKFNSLTGAIDGQLQENA